MFNYRTELKTLILFSIFVIIFIVYITNKNRNYFIEYVPDINSEKFIYNKKWTTAESGDKTYTYKRLNESFDADVIRFHPNLPEQLLITSENLPLTLPDVTRIRWSGIMYQESWKSSPKFLLYSASVDSRIKSRLDVRILALYDEGVISDASNYFCLFWFDKTSKPMKVAVTSAYLIEESKLNYWKEKSYLLSPYMINCNVDEMLNYLVKPFAVSLGSSNFREVPPNILKISGSWERRSNEVLSSGVKVGICGKALFYYNQDFSTRLVEWIEIMRVLGVSKIILYKMSCHKNVERVLEFYERRGFVELISFSYPPPYVQEPTFVRLWTKTQKVPYRAAQKIYINDCILRFKDKFDYLGVFDSDEIPILRRHETIPEFLKSMKIKYEEQRIANVCLKWKHFYTNFEPGEMAVNVSRNLYILRHNKRTDLQTEATVIEETGKCIYDTRNVLAASIHELLFVGSQPEFSQKTKHISRTIAYTGHFGDKICESECLKNIIEEENILLMHEAKISKAVESNLKSIGLKKDS